MHSRSYNCHVNCDEVLVGVFGHHGCEHLFIAAVAGVIFVGREGLRIPTRPFLPATAFLSRLGLVYLTLHDATIVNSNLWWTCLLPFVVVLLLVMASLLLLLFEVVLLCLFLLASGLCEDFFSSPEGLVVAFSENSLISSHLDILSVYVRGFVVY